jgi:hypothetical protein
VAAIPSGAALTGRLIAAAVDADAFLNLVRHP